LNLGALLRAAETGGTMAMVAPYDWKLPDGGSVQPDVMVISREDFDPAGPLPPSAVPLLVGGVAVRPCAGPDVEARALVSGRREQDPPVSSHL
jgi:hypothetical protein